MLWHQTPCDCGFGLRGWMHLLQQHNKINLHKFNLLDSIVYIIISNSNHLIDVTPQTLLISFISKSVHHAMMTLLNESINKLLCCTFVV